MRILSAYKDGFIDPPVMKIMSHLQKTDLDFTAVVVTKREGYEFNPELMEIKGLWVLFDFIEYGWNWDQKETHLFGVNTWDFFKDGMDAADWLEFCTWVRDNPPLIYFKRELLDKDRTEKVLPIEYPCFNPIPEPQSFQDFCARPIEVSYLWGESHPDRVKLHVEMYEGQSSFGYHLLDNAMHIEGCFNDVGAGQRRVWLSQKVPHYARYAMEDVLMIGMASKISVSMPGAGVKCFRHSESPINSVMMKVRDELAWSYPWKSIYNCLCPQDKERIINVCSAATNDAKKLLYTIYRNGVENCRNYHIDNYIPNYVLDSIASALHDA
jgi:hypothetical protein